MKKLLILMSLSLMTLGNYSFTIAMSSDDDGWDDDGYGFYDDNSQSQAAHDVEELARVVADLSIEQQQQRKLGDCHKLIKRKTLMEEIIDSGKKRRGGEVLPEDIRLLEEKRVKVTDELLESIHERKKSAEADAQSAVVNLLHELRQRERKQVDTRAFNALVQKYTSEQDEVFRAQARECNNDEAHFMKLDQNHAKYQKQLLSGKHQLKHVDTVVKQGSLVDAINCGKAEKAAIQQGLEQEVARRRAALMKLLFAPAASFDKSFKFSAWQTELTQKYFKGVDGIEAGKVYALETGDILALLAYSEYLNRLYISNYVFGLGEWNELLTTLVLIYARVIQDAHAVAAVSAFIDNHAQEFATEKFPLDSRLTAWKKSMNKWFGLNDIEYAQVACEGVLAYLSRIWASRIINALQTKVALPFSTALARAKEIMGNMNPTIMPTPAVVCCMSGNAVWDASQALEEAFRMFDFSQIRQEGFEIALCHLNSCQNINDFMTRIFGIQF